MELFEWYKVRVETAIESPPGDVWDNISTQLDIDEVWVNISKELDKKAVRKKVVALNFKQVAMLAVAASLFAFISLTGVFNNAEKHSLKLQPVLSKIDNFTVGKSDKTRETTENKVADNRKIEKNVSTTKEAKTDNKDRLTTSVPVFEVERTTVPYLNMKTILIRQPLNRHIKISKKYFK